MEKILTVGEFLSDYSEETLEIIINEQCPKMTKMVEPAFKLEIKEILNKNVKTKNALKK